MRIELNTDERMEKFISLTEKEIFELGFLVYQQEQVILDRLWHDSEMINIYHFLDEDIIETVFMHIEQYMMNRSLSYKLL